MATINDILETTHHWDCTKGILHIHARKPKKKRLMKAAEESAELATALLQHVNKRNSGMDVLEETIDVLMNIEMILLDYDAAEVKKMYEEKVKKFLNNRDFDTYK